MRKIEQIRNENLKLLIKESGGVNAFALKIGRSQAQVSQWANNSVNSETGKPRNISSRSCRLIEQLFNLPEGWFDIASHSNVDPAPEAHGKVPVISWVTAGKWAEVIDMYQPGVADEWLPCMKNHSDRTFALRVKGISMYNPTGKHTYSDGDIIFVDPDREAINGSRVVVRLEDSKEATFKQLVIEGDKKYLMALNPSWPEKFIPVDENATICGVVIGKWTDE